MKQTGIIMLGNHPRLILDGIKTQTRRVIKADCNCTDICTKPNYRGQILDWVGYKYSNREHWFCYTCGHGLKHIDEFSAHGFFCPYGQVGDRLWLKHRYDLFDIYYKPIEGFEGFYSAGTDGHIYRMDKGEPQVLQEAPTGDKGYLAVTLSKPGYRHTHFVHRLIAKTFYGMPPMELYQDQTRHLDGSTWNNHPSNLDWGTQEDNWADRKYHGRGMGEMHHNSKLTSEQVKEIRKSTKSQRELAYIYNVSQPTIQAVKTRKYWKWESQQPQRNYPEWHGWKSPLFMPRWASRILLEITEVRVERVQEISETDVEREGTPMVAPRPSGVDRNDFKILWDSLNAKRGYGWETNPWVWVISFRRLDG